MTIKEMMVKMGDRMREARRKKGFNQTELAREIGYSLQGLAKIERGESDPALSTIMKIADALDVDLDYMLGSNSPEFIQALQSTIISLAQRSEQAEKALQEASE